MGLTMVEEIVRAVADAENTEPTELDLSLQDWIETDAIRQLSNHDRDTWTLQFEIPNHSVTVTGEGVVFVDGTKKRTHN